ncbi:hypothetical protein BDR26DRAFT_882669 [Obelidium mucronatum]|nr:hypothetical protein BDR26DRAFT_882669 [Obelidium mucronatum]
MGRKQDTVSAITALALSPCLLVICSIRCYNSPQKISIILLIASLLNMIPPTLAFIETWNVTSDPPLPPTIQSVLRHVSIDATMILLYYVYEHRLYLLTTLHYRTLFRRILGIGILLYTLGSITRVVLIALGKPVFVLNVAMVSMDLVLGAIILIGTVYSTKSVLADSSFVHPSTGFYKLILVSDVLRFLVVGSIDTCLYLGLWGIQWGDLDFNNSNLNTLLHGIKVAVLILCLVGPTSGRLQRVFSGLEGGNGKTAAFQQSL